MSVVVPCGAATRRLQDDPGDKAVSKGWLDRIVVVANRLVKL